ncbi:uncharacterized protein LOC127508053 [Ctenopharyngodon idella]|uniref:uncharacterized protein LOC127508053 n=1 Tax=Ctenopharyngodon idella TaxID=7959 RepID=UPI0022307606|nr:uncharacterized protein LOC127508053 [Ctenopharyngodon idella]
MSRASSPDTHWDHLETWLGVMTNAFLPNAAGDLQHLSREQLDGDLNRLMAHDPTQSYNHKEWAKLIGGLAHNLIAQVRLSERSNALLEQEAAALKLQAGEARRNQAQTQHHLDQLLLETQDQRGTADESNPELQEEVERLQKALAELHLEAERKEQLGKESREELTGKLQQGETLLARAEIELKERDAKARACENHLKQARSEILALKQQRDYLRDELDTVHRELKHSYKLQGDLGGEAHFTEFLLASRPSQQSLVQNGVESPLPKMPPASGQEPFSTVKGWEPLQKTRATSHGMAPKDLDKLAKNIPTFTPNPAGGVDVHAYLQDIDFLLQNVANVNAWDRLYLLRITSSRDVRSFLDRQPEAVKSDYQQLRQALIREFSDPESDQGLLAAMDLKQGRLETPQAYYNRIRRAYFGARNEPGMEEDFNFKTLFLRNLHPAVSHHLGVLACPRSMSTQQLRDLAHKAYSKQKAASEKTVKNPTIYPVSNHCPELALKGAHTHHSDRPFHRESRQFPANRGQPHYEGVRPKHQTGRSERVWDKSRLPSNPKGSATWEASRRPRNGRSSSARTSSPDRQRQNASRRAPNKPKSERSQEQNSAAMSESAEILKALKELIQEKHRKEDQKDKPDSL